MDRPTVPQNLTELTDEQLKALAAEIRSYLFHAKGQALTVDSVAEMTAARADYDSVSAAVAERAELAAAAEQALADIPDDDDDDAGADDDDAGADDDEDTEVEAAADTTGPDDDDDDDGEEEPPPAKAKAASKTVAQLNRRQRTNPKAAGTKPKPAATSGMGVFAAKNLPSGIAEGTEFSDPKQFAAAMSDLSTRMGRMTMHGRSFEYVGRAQSIPHVDESLRTLAGDDEHNFNVLDRVTNSRALEQTLVASGALCPPDNPMYDFFRLAQPLNPVEQALPVVPAPRGGIRYIRTPDFRAARAAIGTRTAAENADSETPAKPCARVTCPTVLEAFVTAVSECVLFDNLGYRAFPELVENFMADVAVNFAAVKECLYLTDIDAGSTATTAAIPAYGAARAFFFHARQAAAAYRKRHNMRRDATLQVYAPSWLPDLLAIDMQNDHALGINSLRQVSDAEINQIFSNLNLSPVWFNDQANCNANAANDLQAWRAAQAAAALNPFPTTAVWYIHAPGTFVRLDSGSLDVGLVRDSVLNGTNDLEIFMEQWVGTVKMGNEAIKVTSTLCPSGEAPTAVAAMTCA